MLTPPARAGGDPSAGRDPDWAWRVPLATGAVALLSRMTPQARGVWRAWVISCSPGLSHAGSNAIPA